MGPAAHNQRILVVWPRGGGRQNRIKSIARKRKPQLRPLRLLPPLHLQRPCMWLCQAAPRSCREWRLLDHWGDRPCRVPPRSVHSATGACGAYDSRERNTRRIQPERIIPRHWSLKQVVSCPWNSRFGHLPEMCDDAAAIQDSKDGHGRRCDYRACCRR